MLGWLVGGGVGDSCGSGGEVAGQAITQLGGVVGSDGFQIVDPGGWARLRPHLCGQFGVDVCADALRCGLAAPGVESLDQTQVTVGLVSLAAGLGVSRQCSGVGPLGGEDRQEHRVAAVVGAVLADVGISACSLRQAADAAAAGHTRLDRAGVFPVAGQRQQVARSAGGRTGPLSWILACASARS